MKALAFGGAFNPPTRAHIECAHTAFVKTGAERVVFIPSKMSYVLSDQGKDSSFTDEQRLQMLDRIAFERAWMDVYPGEIEQKNQPRTYETLKRLLGEGYDEVKLLFGSDKLNELQTGWLHVDEICHEFGIVCMTRSKDDVREMIETDPYLKQFRDCITIVETPQLYHEISSTKARKLFHALQKDPDNTELMCQLKEILPEELDGLKEYL